MTAYYQAKAAKRRIDIRKEAALFDRLRRGFERKLESRLKQMFTRQFRTAAKLYEQGDEESMLESLGLELNAIMMPHYSQVIQTFGQKVLDDRAIKFSFEQLVDEYVLERAGKSILDINTYTRKQLAGQISKGLKEGETNKQIAKRIESLGENFSKHRSVTIARTETHSAASWSTHEMHKKFMPANTLKQWVATSDARTRSHHAAMNGKQVPIDEPFEVMTNGIPRYMRYTGDYKGGAANVINCRCSVIYINPSDEIAGTPDTQPETGSPSLEVVAPEESIGSPIGKPIGKPAVKPDEVGKPSYSTVPWIFKDGVKPEYDPNDFYFGDNKYENPNHPERLVRRAHEYGKRYGLTPQQVGHIYNYTTSSYRGMNDRYRKWFSDDPDVSDKEKAAILGERDLVKDAMLKLPKYENEFVWRGVSDSVEKRMKGVEVGSVIRAESYWSTAYIKEKAFDKRLMYKIYSKTGRKIDNMSQYEHETEVLFLPGQEFRVKSIGVSERSGKTYVVLEEIDTEIKREIDWDKELREFMDEHDALTKFHSKRFQDKMSDQDDLVSLDNRLITLV